MKISFTREVKTGLVTMTALVLVIWGFNFLKGKDLLKSYNTYYAITDNVEGIVKSTPVTLKGIEIGAVEDFKFYNGIEKTLLVLSINNDFSFTKDSKIKIYGGNIMGGKSVSILPGNKAEMAIDGDTLFVQKTPGMFDLVNDRLTPLQDKLERIMTSTDTLLIGINNILDAQTQNHIKKSMADMQVVMTQFKQTTYKVNKLLADNQQHLNTSLKNVDKMTANFAVVSDSLRQIKIGAVVKDLNKTIAKLNTSLDKINHGDGTMAKLMNDKKLYDNLERSTKQLEILLKDLKEHPKRYVHFSIWGKKDKK